MKPRHRQIKFKDGSEAMLRDFPGVQEVSVAGPSEVETDQEITQQQFEQKAGKPDARPLARKRQAT